MSVDGYVVHMSPGTDSIFSSGVSEGCLRCAGTAGGKISERTQVFSLLHDVIPCLVVVRWLQADGGLIHVHNWSLVYR